MKNLNITFSDSDFEVLEKEKKKMKKSNKDLTWEMFVICRCLKIRMKGESGKFRTLQ